MRDATHRTDVAYVWPDALQRPPDGVRLVYLDQKDWVRLAKVKTGHRDASGDGHLLDALREAKSRRAVFPLSGTHLMEMAPIKNARHRFEVADVMEELSGFPPATLASRALVMRLELEAVLDNVARREQPYIPVPLVGRGAMFAIGQEGRFRIRDRAGEDITAQVRESYPAGVAAFDRIIKKATEELERSILRGPTASQVAELQRHGWDPAAARRVAETRAQGEREQAQRLSAPPIDPADMTRWRRDRVRDVVRARYVITELMDALEEGLAARGLQIEDVWSDVDASRRVLDSMPSSDVAVSMITEFHRSEQSVWRYNDVFDIDALSVAVAYCNFVTADKKAADALHRGRVAERCGSNVFTTLEGLVAVLAE